MSIEQPTPEQYSELEVFHEEIEALKQAEIVEGKTAHLRKTQTSSEISPNELTDEDRVVWEKLQDKELSRNEFEEYRLHATKEGNGSRIQFAAFIGNLLMIQMMGK